ncbi:sorbosone dehydrogenase family protein [Ferruginibacter sp. HRS2-29]|uniref:PQQ-dependent sugar dehydrogenase n=1 Tax=Ferruginibacter sp. HRS2-29 TaxID=2487334 RepID=UPI0020CD7989|nr:PQQ-dependent sugar dehydrogenase [Ferruginibacter sp. HRS2-29]MCP9750092.1 sorbosone dehydrogenase family protein [Ferruginibacter sp. HRS2-29]
MVKIFISLFAVSCFTLSSCNNLQTKQTETVSADDAALNKKYHLDKITLPAGFKISVYAEVPNARSMTLSPSGILYVGNRGEENVYAVVDENKDGKADKVYKIATGLNTPNGVAFKDGNLYIATINSILRLDNIEAHLQDPPKPVIVYDKFPTDKQHGWKFIAFGPDGKLYVPVGAPCNICESKDPIYASITRMNPDGSAPEIFAHGIRNSVGFSWHPLTKKLWFTENGRDEMGDDVPGDELNTAPDSAMLFGYPYCHQGNILDPEFGKGKNCGDYTSPVQVLGPHVAALGMRFYTGKMFDSSYTNQVFIAEHGSWNRSKAVGYKISLVKLDANGKSLGYAPFAEGWLQPDGKVLGRPVDVEVMQDGALLVSDDYSGAVYKITK